MSDHRRFILDLIDGGCPKASRVEFDALMHWLGGRSNSSSGSITQAFNDLGIPPESAKAYILRYLDRTLFSNDGDYYRLFGVAPGCKFSEIRARHKQLLQTFHPDRHLEDQDWFTRRTELINRAYAHLKARNDKPQYAAATTYGTRPIPPRKAPSAGTSNPGLWKSLIASKGKIRRTLKRHLGSPAVFERRLYIILIAVPVLLLVIVFLNQAGTKQENESSPPTTEKMDGADSRGSLIQILRSRHDVLRQRDHSGLKSPLLDEAMVRACS